MKLLFITPFFRVPADFGIGIRNYQVLDHLTARHEVTVITYGEDESGETDSWLAARGVNVVRLPYSRPWTKGTGRLMALRNLFYYPPASFQRFSTGELSAAIDSCFAKTPDIDLIVFDTELTGQAVLNTKLNKPYAMIVHDIYGESLRRQFKITAWRPHKVVKLVDWLKTSYYERSVLARHHSLITVSRSDEAYLRKHFPGARVVFSSNGVDTERFLRNGHKDDGQTLLFVGGFEYEPNVDAFFYFCREILPLVRAKQPDLKFVAVGRNPTAEMREYAEANDGISLTGVVADVRPYYGRASVVVLPLRFGSGMKLKTLEAFAMGVPVVSTPVGVEGIEVEDGVHCAVAETAGKFAEKILGLLDRPETARAIALHGRDLVTAGYDWKQIASLLEADLRRIAESGLRKPSEGRQA
jgi:glycosyltransferase involved in cell wall biosynthesis